MGTGRTNRKSRYEQLQNYSVVLPEGTELPSGLPPLLAEIDRASAEPSAAAIPVDYPRLRTKLRDQGLPFRAKYNQVETAQVIGVSDRTVRDWTQAGKMPCCRYPSGVPYYNPQNIEDYFTACERPSPRKAGK